MVKRGRVVGGEYVDATVTVNAKGELAPHLGFKRLPKLNADGVAAWEDLTPGTKPGAADAIGPELSGFVARLASLVPGATVRRRHTVRIEWADGKQSLIELPTTLFFHLQVHLKDRQTRPAVPAATSAVTGPPAQPDVAGLIETLATLRDRGILTEAEFATKKAELLARL